MEKEFKYEIKKKLGVLSQNGNYTKEVNLISYNGAQPKLDIRNWDRKNNKMQKGITLNREEMEVLRACLAEL